MRRNKKTDAIILQILLYLFTIYPVIIHSHKSCPYSFCEKALFTIKYPFKTQDQPPNQCQDYINLRCNYDGKAVINLPSSGDFTADYIDYYTQTISLSDPRDCLPRRLMNNFSPYPLKAFRYENYTYYTCPRERIGNHFNVIDCLSNSTNATIATSRYSTGFMETGFGCRAVVSSMIPVSLMTNYDDSAIFSYLELTWNVSGCSDCEDYSDGKSGNDSNSKRRWYKFFGSSLFIASAVVLVTFSGLVCFLRVQNLIARNPDANDTTTDNATTTQSFATTAALAPPQTTGDTPAGSTNGAEDSSKIKSCTEVVIYSQKNQSTSVASGVPCSICLEEYHGKDRVRFLVKCGHCFHAECIDQWLQKNTTCPVCRNPLSK